jgi:ELWxxDGT repeat protein
MRLLLHGIVIPFVLLGPDASRAQSDLLTTFGTDQYGGPSTSVKLNDLLFFSAYDDIHGRELWCTDGTAAGTHMVKDIQPGSDNGIGDYFQLTSGVMDGILYFRGNDGVSGIELWRSDGTEAGTYLLKDVNAGPFDSSVGYLTAVNGTLFFTAGAGSQLWRSDGTTAGTELVRSFVSVASLCAFNNRLYFAADPDNSGAELWKSNGTSVGTVLVKDINGAFGASLPCNFHATTNALYFMASTDLGWELWKTTGTSASTVLVKDINPGGGNGILSSYSDVVTTSLGDTLYFRANDGVNGYQLWRTTGTEASTMRLSELPDQVDAYCTYPIVEGRVMFNNYAVSHWWQYDPATDAVTESGYPFFYFFNTYANKGLFIDGSFCYAGKDTLYGCELWRAEGAAGDEHHVQETHLVDNWSPGTIQGFNSILGNLGRTVLFIQARTAYDTRMPLFSYDLDGGTCVPPGLIIAVPHDANALDLVWNRIAEDGQYEVHYRHPGAADWSTVSSARGYAQLTVASAQAWEYQVRYLCGSEWSSWSGTQTYDPAAASPPGTLPAILADRDEDLTTMRIYWTRTPDYTNMQMRYRPYWQPAEPWTNASNGTGMRRLTDLLPGTLYEYQYRFGTAGAWAEWFPTSLYFVTRGTDIATGIDVVTAGNAVLYPNPSTGVVHIEGPLASAASVTIYDGMGCIVWKGLSQNGTLDLSLLRTGAYAMKLSKDGHSVRQMFIKL